MAYKSIIDQLCNDMSDREKQEPLYSYRAVSFGDGLIVKINVNVYRLLRSLISSWQPYQQEVALDFDNVDVALLSSLFHGDVVVGEIKALAETTVNDGLKIEFSDYVRYRLLDVKTGWRGNNYIMLNMGSNTIIGRPTADLAQFQEAIAGKNIELACHRDKACGASFVNINGVWMRLDEDSKALAEYPIVYIDNPLGELADEVHELRCGFEARSLAGVHFGELREYGTKLKRFEIACDNFESAALAFGLHEDDTALVIKQQGHVLFIDNDDDTAVCPDCLYGSLVIDTI